MHMFNDMVNEKGKAVNLSIKFIGGPGVFKAFEGIEALRRAREDWTAMVRGLEETLGHSG